MTDESKSKAELLKRKIYRQAKEIEELRIIISKIEEIIHNM